ncbi:hypothetical protein [Mycoplasmopsis sturni]|uniref:hypothetical protein n=1 Tax=Mycoplasmopsis sturni TaxID=39047 RepID=UPI000569AD97|nr:hypothetical protein [Mycoplasmopsis sturni]
MLSSKQLQMFQNQKDKGTIAHLYLFSASLNYDLENDLKTVFGILDGQEIQDSFQWHNFHNVLFLDKQNQSISKEELEEIFERADLINVAPKKLFVIIKNIENCSLNGLNSILKSIEEPKDNVVIILTTNNISQLLTTIISRSFVVNIANDHQKEIYQQLQKDNELTEFSELLSYFYPSVIQVKKLNNDKNFELLQKMIQAFEQSLQNKYWLYLFLVKNLDKKKLEQTFFILNCLSHLLTLGLQDIKPDFSWIKKVRKLSQKVLSFHPRLAFAKELIQNFSWAIYSDKNFALQKETFLIDIMRYYE